MPDSTVYRLYDADGDLLYVGVTDDWERRRAEHAISKWWWSEVTGVTLARFPSRPEADDAERAAIRSEDPVFNVAAQQTFGEGARL